MGAHSFVIVANRLPISVSKANGRLDYVASAGGLATALSSVQSANDAVWVGWPGINVEDVSREERVSITRRLEAQGSYPIFLTTDDVRDYYEGYANSTLWPLFHYAQAEMQLLPAYWEAYQRVNHQFAQAIARLAAPDATIWIHDYHLMLLPRLLRKLMPRATIGFFLHTPFPTYEIFRLLPERRATLEGLLGADLLGFHTYDYTQYFMASVRRVLGLSVEAGVVMLESRMILVDTFPIGIDYDKFALTSTSPHIRRAITTLRERYPNQQLVLSMDRLDYSKGIAERLRAFEVFLRTHPEYHKKVSLLVVAVPSRINVQAYKDLRAMIEQMIARINGTFGSAGWAPVSYHFKHFPFEEIVAMLAAADVALITPLRDGMNLVAKEYVASKQTRDGVLVLSEFAGAADELQEAVRVNPGDTQSMAAALEQALRMPATEQRARLGAMQARIGHYTVQRWAADFIDQLELASELQHRYRHSRLPTVARNRLLHEYETAQRRLLLLDYDGTLHPFVSTPDPKRSAPSPKLIRLLEHVAQRPDTTVSIMTGRTKATLETWFPNQPFALVAEYGMWLRLPGGQWTDGVHVATDFMTLVRPLLAHYAERTPGAEVEVKDTSVVWHYRNVPPELAYARTRSLRFELLNALAGTEIGVFEGGKALEIKPREARKSKTVARLISRLHPDFILCAGDDATDEDAFEALPPDAYSIKVGSGRTRARYQLASSEQLLRLLEQLGGR